MKESDSCSVVSNSLGPQGLYSPWDSPGKSTGVGCNALLQGIFPTQESNPGLPHCRWILHHLSYQGSPRILEWVADPSSRGYSRPRNGTSISYTAGRFFTSWATREAPDCARHMEFNNSQNYFKRQRSWSWGIYKPGIKCKENALKNH